MGKKDPRVDAYIAKAADFAKPILKEIRATVHDACPDCEETLKWSSPSFMYKGMMCGMQAFKEYANFGFWKGSLVVGDPTETNPFKAFGRLTKVSDLPPKNVLAGYVKKAMALKDRKSTRLNSSH